MLRHRSGSARLTRPRLNSEKHRITPQSATSVGPRIPPHSESLAVSPIAAARALASVPEPLARGRPAVGRPDRAREPDNPARQIEGESLLGRGPWSEQERGGEEAEGAAIYGHDLIPHIGNIAVVKDSGVITP